MKWTLQVEERNHKYTPTLMVDGCLVLGLGINQSYNAMANEIRQKTGIKILRLKDMIFERCTQLHCNLATLDATGGKIGDCRITNKDFINGYKPNWN